MRELRPRAVGGSPPRGRARAALRRVGGAGIVMALSLTLLPSVGGCVFLIHEKTDGSHCDFAGSADVCGACIAATCGELVDGCCGDDACAASLSTLDDCSTGVDANCTKFIAAGVANGTGALGQLASCVGRKCGGECVGAAPTRTRCTTSSLSDGKTCHCELSSSPNDLACAPAADTVCCAPSGWPAVGQRCSCLGFSCGPTNDGCLCMLGNTPGTSECAGQVCCASADRCRCGSASTACGTGEHAVPSCSLAAVTCPVPQVAVTSCSIE